MSYLLCNNQYSSYVIGSYCLIESVHLAAAHYSCCYMTLPLECAHIKPASKMVQLLLHDLMVLYDSTVLTQDNIQHLGKHLIVI